MGLVFSIFYFQLFYYQKFPDKEIGPWFTCANLAVENYSPPIKIDLIFSQPNYRAKVKKKLEDKVFGKAKSKTVRKKGFLVLFNNHFKSKE